MRKEERNYIINGLVTWLVDYLSLTSMELEYGRMMVLHSFGGWLVTTTEINAVTTIQGQYICVVQITKPDMTEIQ